MSAGSAELLRMAIDASPAGLIVVDRDGRMLLVNKEVERVFGYSTAELIGQPVDMLVPDADRAHHATLETRFMAHPKRRAMGSDRELFGRHKDGRAVPVEIGLNPAQIEDGAVILVSVVDITERRAAAAALAASEKHYRTILEHVGDAIFVNDTTGRYIDANPQACELTGYSREELLQLSFTDTYIPVERHIAAKRMANAIAGHQITFTRPLLRKNGAVILIEGSVIILPNGHALATFRDITERERVAAQTRDSEQRFRDLAENVREIFFIVDPLTGHADYVNPAYEEVFGQSRQYAYTTPYAWTQAIHPEDRDKAVASEREATHDGAPSAVEFRIIRPDGSIRWIRGRATPVRNANGIITRLVGVAEDITEFKRTEAQFLQAQKMEAVGRLAGGIAHDFNNLLTVILSYGALIAGDLEAGDPHGRDIEEMIAAGTRATELTRQLLAFSRQQVLQPKVLDLNALITNVSRMLTRVIGEDVDLATVLGADIGAVKADPGQIEQVLMNLVVNARDAMPDGGKVTIETANVEVDASFYSAQTPITPGRYLQIAVSDTGVGMTEATRSHLFEPFFTTKERGKGTGLGLATVYGIIRQSGGFISVYTEVNRGTTFRIYLPRVDEAAKQAAPSTDAAALDSRGETVLLVEDEGGVRRVAKRILERHGYTVFEAARPDAALALAKTIQRPDLVMTDVILPDMNGRVLARELEVVWPGIKVLYLSGYTDEAIVRHGVLEAGVEFLQKPFTPDGLARKVRHVLDAA